MNFVLSTIALTCFLSCVSIAEGFNYTSIGCYADKKRPARAIASLEGTSPLLDGKYWKRENATAKCAELAHSLNFTIFAVSRGGQCLGDGQANDTFSMHGPSDNCGADGEGGRRPGAMEVYEFTADTCPELWTDCYGDCCDETMMMRQWNTNITEMRCPGYWDWDTQCQLGPDYCVPYEFPNYNNYAPSLGAPETCYGSCSYQCDYPEYLSCWDHAGGCGYSYCYYVGNSNFTGQGPTAMRQFGNNTACYETCPAMCSEYDIACGAGYDSNGCWMGDYCIPAATALGPNVECPGVCYTPCNWEAGETYCPIFSENGCYAGNTCEMPDAAGNACQGPAMRIDPEDELMLRSGSQHSVSAFYKKLTDMARK